MSREVTEMIKRDIIDSGQIDKMLFDYIDDRIQMIVEDKLSQCMCDLLEQVMEEVNYKAKRNEL